MARLPGAYASPDGALVLALYELQPAGCAALRRFETGTGEMKRLYVRPDFRNKGLGRALTCRIIDLARGIGYAQLRLDTLPVMTVAQRLYRSMGFARSPTDGKADPACPVVMELCL